jgi:hypothetical protein
MLHLIDQTRIPVSEIAAIKYYNNINKRKIILRKRAAIAENENKLDISMFAFTINESSNSNNIVIIV